MRCRTISWKRHRKADVHVVVKLQHDHKSARRLQQKTAKTAARKNPKRKAAKSARLSQHCNEDPQKAHVVRGVGDVRRSFPRRCCWPGRALSRPTQPVHRPWSPSGRRWGSEVPVSRPRSWPSAAARLPAAAAGCSKSIDPLLRHEVEGVHRLGSLGYQTGLFGASGDDQLDGHGAIGFGIVSGNVRPRRVCRLPLRL